MLSRSAAQALLLGLEVAERAAHVGERRDRRLLLAGGDDFGNEPRTSLSKRSAARPVAAPCRERDSGRAPIPPVAPR